MSNLGPIFDKFAEKFSDKPFLTFDKTGEKFTYKEFNEKVNQTANFLKSIGIKRGDTVSTYLPNSNETLFVLFVTAKLSAIFNPMTPTLMPKEVEFQLENADSKVFIYNSNDHEKIGKVKGPKLKNMVVTGDEIKETLNFNKEIEKQSKEIEYDKDATLEDKWLMVYTSGTTGKPKGCLLSQNNNHIHTESYNRGWEFTDKDISLVVMPLTHVTGLLMCSYAQFYVGAQVVLTERFSKSRFWKWIDKYKITFVYCVPTMISMLLNPPDDLSNLDTSSLRLFGTGSAPVPVEVVKKFEETFGATIYEVYGLTEVVHASHYNPPHKDKRKLGSIGIVTDDNESKIFDDNDNEVPIGEVGEIVIRGKNVMEGYHKRPDANEKAFKNGWFHSGDLGYVDKDGFFYIVDRKKDIIIRGAENISPGEIDNIIYKIPQVHDSATIGIPDKIYGEEVITFVVPKQGEKITEQEIIGYCEKHIAKFKCPKRIVFTDEIPKGPSGKLLRKELRKKF